MAAPATNGRLLRRVFQLPVTLNRKHIIAAQLRPRSRENSSSLTCDFYFICIYFTSFLFSLFFFHSSFFAERTKKIHFWQSIMCETHQWPTINVGRHPRHLSPSFGFRHLSRDGARIGISAPAQLAQESPPHRRCRPRPRPSRDRG